MSHLALLGAGKSNGGSAGAPAPVTYNGARVSANHFDGTNKIISTSLVQFGTGYTMNLVIDFQTNALAGNEAIVSCGRGSFGTGIGYAMAIGQFTNNLYIVNYLGAFALLATGLRIGINSIELTWKASDSSFDVSVNGLPFNNVAGSGAGVISFDVDCFTSIGQGSPTDTQNAFQDGGVLGWSVVHAEVSTTDIVADTTQIGAVNRLIPCPRFSALGTNTFDWNAYRDWNGSAGTSTSQGSSPVIFTIGGTVTRTDFSEVRRITTDAMYWDSAISTPTTSDFGETFTRRNSYARLNVTTSADRVTVECGSTANEGLFGADYGAISCYSNGVYAAVEKFNEGVATHCADLMLPAGSNKNVDMNEGMNYLNGDVRGTYIVAFRIRVGSTFNAPAPVSHWVGVMCDSIGEGFKAATPVTQSPAMLLRYGVTSGTSVTVHGWASGTTKNFIGDAGLRATFVAQVAIYARGTISNKFIIQIGTNDFGLGVWLIAAYKAAWKATIEALQIAVPGIVVIFQSPIQRISPDGEGPNNNAEFLSGFRTAQQEIAMEETSVVYHEGAAEAVVSNSNLDGDGLHPGSNGVGSAQLGTAFISYV